MKSPFAAAAAATAPKILDPAIAAELTGAVAPPARLQCLIAGAAGAPFLARLMRREADWLSGLWDQPVEASFQAILDGLGPADPADALTPSAPFGVALRTARRRAALLIALADLGGVWDLDQTTAALTRFADHAVQRAVAALLAREGARGAIAGFDPARPGYVLLAMGKMGAHELNYSSDIDLIALFDQDRFTPAAAIDAQDRFIRLTKALVKLLSERTGEGYVARVDLRLRPDPGATPVCLSMTSAEAYYEALGRSWERAAHIKARPVAGDLAAGAAYLERLRPFVWRRHLDFAALEDAAGMLQRIREHEGGAEIAVAGQDVKLGAGGIREIEFLAQSLQLVLGGRDAGLRAPRTRQALIDLADRGRISAADLAALDAAYAHLRALEHRLQMVEDEQTHRMPTDPAALARVAALMGMDWPALEAATAAHMTAVRRAAAPDLDRRGGAGAPDCSGARFPEPERASAIASAWFSGKLRAVRSQRARAALERLSPKILDGFAEAADPMGALLRFDRFLGNLPAGAQFLALVEANPKLLDLLIEICAAAPRLADHLARRTAVLDAVLDQDFFAAPPGLPAMTAELAAHLAEAEDYERALDALRRWAAERRFQVGVLLLQGALAPAAAGRAFSDIAEASVTALTPIVAAEHAARYGAAPEGAFGGGAAVLALGRLGSREMTATSDLDIIIVYDAAPTAESGGPKPVAAPQYYARFTQRLVAALTAPTTEGALYEVDMRLRPSGRAGPLATAVSAFERYQREDAWVWEHLALTRARVVAGPAPLAEAIGAAMRSGLARPRAAGEIRRAAVEMRAKLDAAHAPALKNPWAVKIARGGLVDLEFIAQALLLEIGAGGVGGWSAPEGLRAAAAEDALDGGLAEALASAHDLQSAILQIERVALDGYFDPAAAGPGVRGAFLRATGAETIEALERQLSAAQAEALSAFDRVLAAAAPD